MTSSLVALVSSMAVRNQQDDEDAVDAGRDTGLITVMKLLKCEAKLAIKIIGEIIKCGNNF